MKTCSSAHNTNSASSLLPITISREGLDPPRESPLLGVVKPVSPIDYSNCLLPEDCKPPVFVSKFKDLYYIDLDQERPDRLSYVRITSRNRPRNKRKNPRGDLPWTPEPLNPKLFGFDVYGNAIDEYYLPGIGYTLPDFHELVEDIFSKQITYKESRLRKQNLYKMKMYAKYHKAKNPHELPVEERETVGIYLKRMMFETSDLMDDEPLDTNLQDCYRIRRKIEIGSYSSKTVKENFLPKIIRYSWKGKILKLQKHLKVRKNRLHINLQDYYGRTALHYAASWGCFKTVRILLEVPGIDLNLTDNDGKTPLYKAVEIGSLSCVQLLIDNGCIVRIPAYDGRNPFEFALQELGDNHFDILKYLYHEGRLYKERKMDGRLSFLHIACLTKKKVETYKIITELISAGEFVNATEGNGKTPLMLAVQLDRYELVKLFLKFSADIFHIDMKTKAAIQYAKQNSKVHSILRQYIDRLNKSDRKMNSIDYATIYHRLFA